MPGLAHLHLEVALLKSSEIREVDKSRWALILPVPAVGE